VIHVEIPLSNGGYTTVSARDLDVISGYTWRKTRRRNTFYAVAHVPGTGKKHKRAYIHRVILGDPNGEVDHINRNGLDNTRENLRLASRRVNRMNSKEYQNNKTGFRGVQRDKRGSGRYISTASINGKTIYLGRYNTPEEAHEIFRIATGRKVDD